MKIGEIENGIPMPKLTRRSKYPFGSLDIGQSFLVTCSEGEELKTIRSRIYSTAGQRNRRGDKRFIAKTVGPIQVRVWRIA